jgi:hypothetical protein
MKMEAVHYPETLEPPSLIKNQRTTEDIYSILNLGALQLRITKRHIPNKIFYSDEGSSTFLRNTGISTT